MTIIEILRVLNNVVSAYDALAPDWRKAPSWAQWYAIDASKGAMDRHGYFYANEPILMCSSACWASTEKSARERKKKTQIPIGIDWRLCKWQRPQVQS